MKYGYEGEISDSESLKLLSIDQKKEWFRRKRDYEVVQQGKAEIKEKGVTNISDMETFELLTEGQR